MMRDGAAIPGATSRSSAVKWAQERQRWLILHGQEEREDKSEAPEMPTLAKFCQRFIDEYVVANRLKPSTIENTKIRKLKRQDQSFSSYDDSTFERLVTAASGIDPRRSQRGREVAQAGEEPVRRHVGVGGPAAPGRLRIPVDRLGRRRPRRSLRHDPAARLSPSESQAEAACPFGHVTALPEAGGAVGGHADGAHRTGEEAGRAGDEVISAGPGDVFGSYDGDENERGAGTAEDGEKDPSGEDAASLAEGRVGGASGRERHGVLLRPLRHGLHGRLGVGLLDDLKHGVVGGSRVACVGARWPGLVGLGRYFGGGGLCLEGCGSGERDEPCDAGDHGSRVEAAPRAPRLSRERVDSLVLGVWVRLRGFSREFLDRPEYRCGQESRHGGRS